MDESAQMWSSGCLGQGRACKFQWGRMGWEGLQVSPAVKVLLAAGSCFQGIPDHILSVVNWSSAGISWCAGQTQSDPGFEASGFGFCCGAQPPWNQDSEFPLLAVNIDKFAPWKSLILCLLALISVLVVKCFTGTSPCPWDVN